MKNWFKKNWMFILACCCTVTEIAIAIMTFVFDDFGKGISYSTIAIFMAGLTYISYNK